METKEKIEKVLDEIRPHLAMDGGNVEFVDFDESTGELKVKLQGACSHCPMSQITLQEGIGQAVKEKVAEVKAVVGV